MHCIYLQGDLVHYTVQCKQEVPFYLIVFFGTAKVNKLDHSPTGDHDVGSLDVSMDDGVGVKVVEGSGDLTSVVGYGTAVQGTESAQKDLVQVGYYLCSLSNHM